MVSEKPYYIGQRVRCAHNLSNKDASKRAKEFIVLGYEGCPHKGEECPKWCATAVSLASTDGGFRLLECSFVSHNDKIQPRFKDLGNDPNTYATVCAISCNLESGDGTEVL